MSFKYERFLIEAIEQCHLYKIITCVKHGHNIHIENNHGQNLLIHLLKQQNSQDIIFEKKRLQIFQFLITHCNFDIHTFDYYGKNIFNWATNLNCTQEALYLLRSYPGDIDILIRDQSGLCSLHYAIEHGNEILVHAIVDYLLQYRIRFDINDNHNNTPEELAKKLGYDRLSNYLSETCRLTIFMSREIPFIQKRLSTNKLKSIINTKSSMTTILDLSEFYNLIESKIETAKNLNDWKTVAVLRKCQTNPNGKKLNQLPTPTPQINQTTRATSSISSKLPSINLTSLGGQSGHMLHLIEPQLSPSYRKPFIPYYQRPIIPTVGILPSSNAQRRMSVASSRRMSSVMSHRKRESNASQLGVLLGAGHKQHRQSIVSSRMSDADALTKLRTKHMITIQN